MAVYNECVVTVHCVSETKERDDNQPDIGRRNQMHQRLFLVAGIKLQQFNVWQEQKTAHLKDYTQDKAPIVGSFRAK